jgi:hypothetical protein
MFGEPGSGSPSRTAAVDFYLGYVTYRRGHERRPGTHPPIVSHEQASAVARIKLRRHRPGRPDVQHRTYVLQGMAYCPCGLRMRGEAIVRPVGPSIGTTGVLGAGMDAAPL